MAVGFGYEVIDTDIEGSGIAPEEEMDNLTDRLDCVGIEGWELCAVLPLPNGQYRYIFKCDLGKHRGN